jgi:cyclic-di-AMP phosphodiesterase PgpH
MAAWNSPSWLLRGLAAVLALVAVPGILSISAFLQDAPIRLGEPSPRTVVAPDSIQVPDQEATERAQREAMANVAPIVIDDEDARVGIVADVRDAFARIEAVRTTSEGQDPLPRTEQIAALADRLTMLDAEGLRLATGMTDAQLAQAAGTAESIALQLVREPIREDRIDDVQTRRLQSEVAVRSLPPGIGEQVVTPIIRAALRPTVREDTAATEAAREQAASDVAPVQIRYEPGRVIVNADEVVSEVQMAALRARGLEGAEPWRYLLRLTALTLVLIFAVVAYLRVYRQRVWGSTRRMLLLASLLVMFAMMLEAIIFVAPAGSSAWMFVLPAGAIAMLATILFDPPIGVLSTIPITALVAFAVPGEPGLIAFVAIAALGSVPLVSRLSARGDLRKAALRSTLGYGLLAAVCAAAFGPLEAALPAFGAGLLNGVVTAVIVMGSLPFLESVFGILTATSLLDLADRNHPLLRELEQKALGSYNHSIMVSTMVERACRAVGADALLGSVAALYHDIGKVRRPYFFVENQFAIANPHDELEPRVSAVIIQEHVTDGIEMARSYRLPPEVVEGIATHHGTTLVSYFYRQAVLAAKQSDEVDESHYRYKGRKPSSKEMAILMLADCCEGASRATALTNRNLSKTDLEDIVHGLIDDRVEDGQLDEANLTFRELKTVQESFIETLVGVYHPRIAYPSDPKKSAAASGTDGGGAADGGTGDAADGGGATADGGAGATADAGPTALPAGHDGNGPALGAPDGDGHTRHASSTPERRRTEPPAPEADPARSQR